MKKGGGNISTFWSGSIRSRDEKCPLTGGHLWSRRTRATYFRFLRTLRLVFFLVVRLPHVEFVWIGRISLLAGPFREQTRTARRACTRPAWRRPGPDRDDKNDCASRPLLSDIVVERPSCTVISRSRRRACTVRTPPSRRLPWVTPHGYCRWPPHSSSPSVDPSPRLLTLGSSVVCVRRVRSKRKYTSTSTAITYNTSR